ncbi:MAG: hypothetical protein WD824_10420 [Cyclobacteriaceae bacterium]
MKKGKRILIFTVGGIAFLLVLGLVTMFLWNWLIPGIFNGPEIRFLEALGLLLFCKILFSGFGGGRRWRNAGGQDWKHRYYEKLSCMRPEDRERFKNRMREKWCSPATPEPKQDVGNTNV